MDLKCLLDLLWVVMEKMVTKTVEKMDKTMAK